MNIETVSSVTKKQYLYITSYTRVVPIVKSLILQFVLFSDIVISVKLITIILHKQSLLITLTLFCWNKCESCLMLFCLTETEKIVYKVCLYLQLHVKWVAPLDRNWAVVSSNHIKSTRYYTWTRRLSSLNAMTSNKATVNCIASHTQLFA